MTSMARRAGAGEPLTFSNTSSAAVSRSRPNPSQSWTQAIFAFGLCWRSTPKIVGKIPLEPTATGEISNLPGCQSLEVTPCCSGPAPMIMEAQFGLLTVGITPRACKVQAPSRISRCTTGALLGVNPTEPRPSQPMTTTCWTLANAAPDEGMDKQQAPRPKLQRNSKLQAPGSVARDG